MKNKISPYAETLAGAIDIVNEILIRDDIDLGDSLVDGLTGELSESHFTAKLSAEPVNYEQTRTFDFSIDTLKGKPARKWFHVSIYRMPTGRYEVTTCVL